MLRADLFSVAFWQVECLLAFFLAVILPRRQPKTRALGSFFALIPCQSSSIPMKLVLMSSVVVNHRFSS
jgi:hypothetical protein